MKQYLPGLIAIVLAITAFAFTDAPFRKLRMSQMHVADVCPEASKQWYTIQLSCSQQGQLPDLRNPANYSLSSQQEVNYLCSGSECVCAIWACPSAYNGLPNIGSNTKIYNDLYNHFKWGTFSFDIALKDEIYEQRRR